MWLQTRIDPWVREHVIPHLDQKPEDYDVFCGRVAKFLGDHRGEPVVADWPCDFGHLLAAITLPDGECRHSEITMHLVSGLDCKPDRPHNALSDAYALMRAWKASGRSVA